MLTSRSSRTVAGVLVALVLTSGCTAPTSTPAPSATSPSATSTSDPGASPTTASTTPDTSASPSTPAPPVAVIASKNTSVEEVPLRIDLVSVRVEGGLTLVDFAVTNTGTKGSLQVAAAFNDGSTTKDANGKVVMPSDYDSADGVYLLDDVSKKRYLPARNAQGSCVCSVGLSATFVRPGQSVTLSAVFKAVPAEVSTITVYIPKAGTFTNVPVSR